MHYTGQIYRPPFEAASLLVQATVGCSHNACTFCTMYHGTKFQTARMEDIEADLREAAAEYPFIQRVFLVNADAFVLSADRLAAIAEKAHEYLPKVKTIGMYASVKNVIGKTDEELAHLHELGIDGLNIGLESGLDEVLAHLNKGFTVEEARTQLARLRKAGINYSLNIMLGAAGSELWEKNAIANARILNETQPSLVFTALLHVDPGAPLLDEVKAGTFREDTLGQYVTEELEMLRGLELEDATFYGLHTSNVIPVQGILPRDKDALVKRLEDGLARIPERYLDSHPEKGYEGISILR
ncbi:MAG: radical SAM protein [Atopobiaceae bacterium]|jgi:radical SAM superfamily enzyme YgiQ (UPF0313 family)|nr:radical SAM protein [Atopobiaceae bacterium]